MHRITKITENTTVSNIGGTWEGIIIYCDGGGTGLESISIHDANTVGSADATNDIATFVVSDTSLESSEDYRGYKVIVRNGLTVKSTDFTQGLTVYVIHN